MAAVSTGDPLAIAMALRVLRGGNAFDAAVTALIVGRDRSNRG